MMGTKERTFALLVAVSLEALVPMITSIAIFSARSISLLCASWSGRPLPQAGDHR